MVARLFIIAMIFIGGSRATPSAAAAEATRHSDLSGAWQLFVDDCLIAHKQGISRTFHPFEKHPQNPLDGVKKYGGRGTVLPGEDGTGYRMWSGGGRRYYTSADGLSWDGSTKTTRNILDSHGCASVIETPWDDPTRRFKMVTSFYDKRQRTGALAKGGGWYGSVSPDGIHWTATNTNPLFRDRSDVGKFCWDAHRQRFFGTPKIWTDVRGHSRRSIGISASKQFDAAWPTATLMLVPDQVDDLRATGPGQHTDFYGLGAFAYESMYLGLLEVFRVTDGINDGPINLELVTSRDGVHWQRMPGDRQPILAVGPPGAWDAGMIKGPNHPIVAGDTIQLFYGGSNKTHGFGRSYHRTRDRAGERTGGTGLATLRKDGFASLDAGTETGSITTVKLTGASGRLAVNYRAATNGWIKVEILDQQGDVIPGYGQAECHALAGDKISEFVAWDRFDKLPSDGRTVRLRFYLRNVSLFSFHAGSSVTAEIPERTLAVLYTFDDARARDVLTADGAQNPFFTGAVRPTSGRSKAAFGDGCVEFTGNRKEHRDTLEIDDSFRLGPRFTLAAQVKAAREGRMRLFSSWEPFPVRVDEPPYHRQGSAVGDAELLFDFDVGRHGAAGRLRLAVHGQELMAATPIALEKYHHLAATFDDGTVKLYLDGRLAREGRVPGGEVALLANLRVGEDCGPLTNRSSGITSDEQFLGVMDDILVIARVLSPTEVRALADEGAAAVFDRIREEPRRD